MTIPQLLMCTILIGAPLLTSLLTDPVLMATLPTWVPLTGVRCESANFLLFGMTFKLWSDISPELTLAPKVIWPKDPECNN